MAALLQCFRKNRKNRENFDLENGSSTNANGKVGKQKMCKCIKPEKLATCPECKSTLVGYWEKNEIRPDGGIISKAVKNFCDNHDREGNSRGSSNESDSYSAEHSPTSPTASPGIEMGNSNMGYYDYTPGVGLPYFHASKDDPNYYMEHRRRGKAIIFNFNTFDNANTNVRTLELQPRNGSDKDKRDLAECLENLGFQVVTYENLRRQKYDKIIDKVRKEDHSDADCLVIAIMTHGEKNLIYTSDGSLIPVNSVWEQFESNLCPTLAGKPKIFIIQACRGDRYDHGTRISSGGNRASTSVQNDVTDAGSFSYVIPNAADIIVAFSCPLGHYSWRHPEKGSWFIQSICKIFNKYAYQGIELQALLTMVAREVALNYESITDHIDSDKKKQVPSTSSTLIRNVYFKPKPVFAFTEPLPRTPVANDISVPAPIPSGISNGQLITVAQVGAAVAEAQATTTMIPEPEPALLEGPPQITVADDGCSKTDMPETPPTQHYVNGFSHDEDLGPDEDPSVASPQEKPILPSK